MADTSNILETKIKPWIKQALNIDDFEIEIEGTTAKGEGYLGEFLFVKVIPKNDQEEQHVVVKMGKSDPELRKQFAMFRNLCEREVVFYQTIIPTFEKFLKTKNTQISFDVVPKCFKTILDDNNEVLIMENLKTQGYEIHPMETTLNIHHMHLGLKYYAKLHAVSFAIKDQDEKQFEAITKVYPSHMVDAFTSFKAVFENNPKKIVNNLKECGREDLASKYEKLVEKGPYDYNMKILEEEPDEKVVVHADCHCGNIMFKYKDEDKQIPSKMVLIDFQCSILHSPIMDVSSFLYINMIPKDLSQLKELLQFYYKHLSTYLIELGTDPEKVFPESTMWKHWEKYADYGFHLGTVFMEVLFAVKEEAPAMNLDENGDLHHEFMNIKLISREKYLQRLVGVIEGYFKVNK